MGIEIELDNKELILDTIKRVREIKDDYTYNRKEVYIINVITMSDLILLLHDTFIFGDGEQKITVGINELSKSQIQDFIMYIFDSASKKFNMTDDQDIIHIRSLLIEN